MIDYSVEPDRCVTVGITTPEVSDDKTEEYLDELAFLIDTAGGRVEKRFTQKLQFKDPRTFVGSGKLEQIRDYIKENDIEWVVFDDELSPSQARNVEKILECHVLDRTGLILNIFRQ